jgi:hypothetical protein
MRSTLVLILASVLFQGQPPDTEVYLATLKIDGDSVTVSSPVNISNRAGYDNQPSFTADGGAVFFTSARGGGAGGAQMDIYRYDIASSTLTQVTRTAESEYSATLMPDGRHISVIRVEADKTQRLWKFPLAGGAPSVILADVKPVGYHAWIDENTVAMFVLGQPATLQVADVRTGRAVVVATDIGRSLQPVPGGGVSFIQRSGSGGQRTMTVSRLTLAGGQPATQPLTPTPPGATEEFVAWAPDGTALIAAGGQLHAWRRGSQGWRAVADLSALGLKNVSRLAVSPAGDRLALVAAR